MNFAPDTPYLYLLSFSKTYTVRIGRDGSGNDDRSASDSPRLPAYGSIDPRGSGFPVYGAY